MPAGKDPGEERFKKFLKALDDLAKSVKASAKLNEELVDALGDEEEGFTAAVADLTDEIRGLREDLRAMAKTRGLQIFSILARR